jgi:hypothetical protein
VKIRGTCQNCGKDFFVQQVRQSGGHCPNCGLAFQPHYTAVLVEGLEIAEAAGSTLESALEKLAGMGPALVVDEQSVLGDVTAHLAELRAGEKPRYP